MPLGMKDQGKRRLCLCKMIFNKYHFGIIICLRLISSNRDNYSDPIDVADDRIYDEDDPIKTIDIHGDAEPTNDDEDIGTFLAPSNFNKWYFISHKPKTGFFCEPVVAARLKKIEESIRQQAELHQAQMTREQLELKRVQDEMQRHASLHAHRLDKEHEV